MASGRTERDPLVALRAGDPAPFEDFVRCWTRNLTAYFSRQGAALNRAEDLTQEVFLKLYQSAARYRPEERFQAYCFRTARNVWIDDCRRSAARAEGALARGELEPVESLGTRSDPGAGLVFEEEERSLRARIDALPAGQRRVFELALLAELSYAEIGALLAIPVGTVKSRMFHAVRRLRRSWNEQRQREGVA
jgi:RNA polymerase sigma-70 factor (ECF subfamily)